MACSSPSRGGAHRQGGIPSRRALLVGPRVPIDTWVCFCSLSPSRARLRRLALVRGLAHGSRSSSSCCPRACARRGGHPTPTVRRDVPSSTHKVTLVTGDVVTVTTMADGRQIADVDRPDDAVGGVRIQEINGDLYVIPDEAVALLGADRLDRRLFNVTDLIEMGYDDANGQRAADRDVQPRRGPRRRARRAPPTGSKRGRATCRASTVPR